MRRLATAAALVVIWVLLWDTFSLANIVSGALLAGLLLIVFPDPGGGVAPPPVFRPVALIRLANHVVVGLVWSNAVVTHDVLSPRPRVHTGIVACPLRSSRPQLLGALAAVTALSPGKMPLEIRRDPPTIYLHVLHLADPADVRRSIAVLEERLVRALGTADDIAALGRPAAALDPGAGAP
ncbi:MAG: Na+/H+ antiporter subunit E [Acidimicrobiia bacterium]|jgi:multicomponent Na+:H+ antiporter subunit E|nr:Na+/H+ antiporter subunit E [Acidimicrobiia bacterium]